MELKRTIAGLVNVVSFIAYIESVRKVIIADIIAMVALLVAGVIHIVSRNQSE